MHLHKQLTVKNVAVFTAFLSDQSESGSEIIMEKESFPTKAFFFFK